MHNEIKLNEMVKILLALNKYVPSENTEVSMEINGTSYVEEEASVALSYLW